MDLLKEERHFLVLLVKTSKHQAVSLIKTLSDDQTRVLTEIVVNFLNDKLPGPVHRLKAYKEILREVGHYTKRVKINKKLMAKYALKWYNIIRLLKPGLIKILS